MSRSYTKIWIHAIFGTKFRQPLIRDNFKIGLHSFLMNELTQMNCFPKIVNGTSDHVHLLFRLNPQKNVSDIIKNLKGLSSHWVNEQNVISEKFIWQGGYGAFSVSETSLEKAYNYILHQEEHHKKISYKEEMDKFLKLSGLFMQ